MLTVFAALNPKEEIKTLVAAESRVKLECQNDEYYSQNLPEDHGLEGSILTNLLFVMQPYYLSILKLKDDKISSYPYGRKNAS